MDGRTDGQTSRMTTIGSFSKKEKNTKKSRLSDMHCPLTDIQADFEINRPVRYRNTAKKNYFHRRQTDRQTDVAYDNNM